MENSSSVVKYNIADNFNKLVVQINGNIYNKSCKMYAFRKSVNDSNCSIVCTTSLETLVKKIVFPFEKAIFYCDVFLNIP